LPAEAGDKLKTQHLKSYLASKQAVKNACIPLKGKRNANSRPIAGSLID